MSNEMTDVQEPEWPTHCEHCRTELRPQLLDLVQGEGDQEIETAVAQDVCPNPDCPAAQGDVAPMTDAESEEWLDRPGTEGGANGGA